MADAEKREKVIRKLEELLVFSRYNDSVGWNPYNDTETLEGAVALLKAQEPRVMTLEEVKQEHICWIEDADGGMTVRLFPATMFGIGEYANGSKAYIFLAQKPWAIDANDFEWWYLIEDYGKIWRPWTSRPTDARREATPWR